MQFSLDRKRRCHRQNRCSASDSVGLIFTGSYRSTLLITTPTTTPSQVKTSLTCALALTSKWSRTAISNSTLISHLLFYSSMCESIEFLKGDHWGKEIERGQPYKTGYAKLKDWLHKQHRHIDIHLDFQDFIENNIVVIWSCNCKTKEYWKRIFFWPKSNVLKFVQPCQVQRFK